MANLPQERLPPKLEAVLVRLCRQAPRPLNITQAVKMPYLVDVLAAQVLGGAITEGHHQTWKLGVVTSEAWHYLHKCPPESPLRILPVPFSEELCVEADEKAAMDALLSEEECRIVDFVAGEFAFRQAWELGRMTKRMNPGVTAWGANQCADTGPDAYERMSPDYLEMADFVDDVSLAQLRRESEPIASPEEAVD